MVQLISASPRPARLNSASTELLISSASAVSLKYPPSFKLSEFSSRVMIPVDPSSKSSALASSSASRDTSIVTSHQGELRIADCGLRISEVINRHSPNSQFIECALVVAPALAYLHKEIQEHVAAEQLLDILASRGNDILKH